MKYTGSYSDWLLSADRAHFLEFFGENDELTSLFYDICKDLLAIDEGLTVRGNSSIIGLSEPRGRFRFYIIHPQADGQYWIKYKHLKEKLPFSPCFFMQYQEENRRVCTFFDQHPEYSVSARKTPCNEQMQEQRDCINGLKELRQADTPPSAAKQAEDDLAVSLYEKLTASHAYTLSSFSMREAEERYRELCCIFESAAYESLCLDERDIRIFKGRFLEEPTVTLRSLGAQFAVSHEAIRLREKKIKQRLRLGLYIPNRRGFQKQREAFFALLLAIPCEMFFSILYRIEDAHPTVGGWMMETLNWFEKRMARKYKKP